MIKKIIKMKKIFLILTVVFLSFCIGCSEDSATNNNPPSTGEVLLAAVDGDSAGAQNSVSTIIRSVTGQTLNFTDRDSARISFYYSGNNNSTAVPFQIYDTNNVILYQADNLTITPTEQFINITLPSPRVNNYFRYQIKVISNPGSGYFKFRELKIYKK